MPAVVVSPCRAPALPAAARLGRHDLEMELLSQNQLAQLGGLQAVNGAVVDDGDGLVAAQQFLAFDQTGGHGRALCIRRVVGDVGRAGGLVAGVHGACRLNQVVRMITILICNVNALPLLQARFFDKKKRQRFGAWVRRFTQAT